MIGYRADFHGAGHLVIGQWYANHQCAKVHGAHGIPESGISGNVTEGAFPIVLSSGYSNEDHGTTITYCGTKGREPTNPPQVRKPFLTAYEKGNPVRRILTSQGRCALLKYELLHVLETECRIRRYSTLAIDLAL